MRAFFSAAAICLLSFLVACSAKLNPLEQEIDQAFQAGEFPGLHSSIVIKNKKVLAENYFSGKDENWGRKLGFRRFHKGSLHDVRSVSKSIVGLLYGIAHDEGKVPGPNERLMDYFPEFSDIVTEKHHQIKIKDVLTMRMGIKWNEELPYTDPNNSEIAMENAKNRYRFILSQPVTTRPGGQWVYSGGATAILARLIKKGTGQSIDRYAKEKLFEPLGIEHFEWNRGWDGVPSAASGLRLTMRDLAKIGQMIADGGVHGGNKIISQSWMEQAFKPRIMVE